MMKKQSLEQAPPAAAKRSASRPKTSQERRDGKSGGGEGSEAPSQKESSSKGAKKNLLDPIRLTQDEMNALLWRAMGAACVTGGGGLERARDLLKAGANPNARMKWEGDGAAYAGAPLWMALMSKKPKGPTLARLLLEAGADPNEAGEAVMGKSKREFSALIACFINGSANPLEGVKLALSFGADAKATEADGFTAAHRACLRSDAQSEEDLQRRASCLEELARAGADLEAQDDLGKSPADYAARNCNPPALIKLFELGASMKLEEWEEGARKRGPGPWAKKTLAAIEEIRARMEAAEIDRATPMGARAGARPRV